MEKSKKIRKSRGITLIALIVTIIVMLILLGVVAMTVLNAGLFNEAGKAVRDSNNKTAIEQNIIDELMNEFPDEDPEDPTPGENTVPGDDPVNHAPKIIKNELNDKTTSSFTIDVNATDEDKDDLTYKIYIRSDEDSRYSTYTLMKTTESTPQNTPRQLTVENLNEYTLYYWYITVEDGTEVTTSEEKSVRTYCPGGTKCLIGEYCTKATYEKSKCLNSQCTGLYYYKDSDTFKQRNTEGTEFDYVDSCMWCGEKQTEGTMSYSVYCTSCSYELRPMVCYNCANSFIGVNCDNSSLDCDLCKNGWIETPNTYCPTHKSCTRNHYWCSTHNCASSSTGHQLVCGHGKTGKHDD